MDDRRTANPAPEGAAGPLPDGVRERAPVRPRQYPSAPGTELRGTGGSMIDADAFAGLICDWCVEAKAGAQVIIGSPTRALPLLRGLHRAVLEREAWPLLRVAPPWLSADFYTHAGETHLDGYAPLELIEAENADAQISIMAPANTRGLAGI